nr:MAG TPA: PsbA, PsbB, PsbC, PsbD, PsbE-FCP supercomplex, PLANT PROTEIN [Caudoviricetes sp.]DAF72119.1 MAG TPA: PsbA, PsbB, PsbC, PsbD, PsbE-FCP supercomplex, PLANT PROTEIN [Caudoviricetes sp.]
MGGFFYIIYTKYQYLLYNEDTEKEWERWMRIRK